MTIWVQENLVGKIVEGEVLERHGSFVNIRVSPFVIGGCHIRNWRSGGYVDPQEADKFIGATVQSPGWKDSITKGNLSLNRKVAEGQFSTPYPLFGGEDNKDAISFLEFLEKKKIQSAVCWECWLLWKKRWRTENGMPPKKPLLNFEIVSRFLPAKSVHLRAASACFGKFTTLFVPAERSKILRRPANAGRIALMFRPSRRARSAASVRDGKICACPGRPPRRMSPSSHLPRRATFAEGIRENTYSDRNPLPGLETSYSVEAEANNVFSKPTDVEILMPAEVMSLSPRVIDRTVHLRWTYQPRGRNRNLETNRFPPEKPACGALGFSWQERGI